MGIHGLMKLLSEECPGAIKEQEMENYTGRKIAIDASPGGQQAAMMLTNDSGEITSHIQGMFNRTIKMMSAGIKPVYVFDGKPPQLKGGELAKRLAKRSKAEADLAAAKESGDLEEIDKYSRRLVKVNRQHNEDCKELLRLMGVPVIDAPGEAEAQCAELAKQGRVWATATEDMDALTFRTPRLIRRLTFSQGKEKQPILEIDVEAVLAGLFLSYEQFVDLCVLCGCDYCSTIRGVGPKTALRLIKQLKTIENVLSFVKRAKKYEIGPDFKETRVKREEEGEKEGSKGEEKKEGEGDKEGEMKDKCEEEEEEDPEKKGEEEKVGEGEEGVEEEEEGEVEEGEEGDDLLLGLEDFSYQMEGEGETKKEGGEGGEEKRARKEKECVDVDGEGEGGAGTSEGWEVFPPIFSQARHLFLSPSVLPAAEVSLQWREPDEAGLRAFLVERMGFNLERVNNGIKKLQEAQQKKSQKRMDSFFSVIPSSAPANTKRKVEEKPKKGNTKSYAGKKR